MSVVNCPECSGTVEDTAITCVHCGAALISTSADSTTLPPFFAVSILKLAVMSFFTLGLYELYWFYRNWQRIRVCKRRDIKPSLRALFGFFFCYACFAEIRNAGLQRGIGPAPPIGVLTAGWILLNLTWRLPPPFWLVSLLSWVFLLPVQSYANRINREAVPAHDVNSRFTIWNWLGIVAGGILLLLGMIGLVIPVE